jgi:hypothetical protein
MKGRHDSALAKTMLGEAVAATPFRPSMEHIMML